LKKGSRYYIAFMEENLKLLLFHLAEVEQLTRTKTYRNALSEVDQQLTIAWSKLEQVEPLAGSILWDRDIERSKEGYSTLIERRSELWELAQKAAEDNPKLSKRKSGRKRKKGAKLEKGETYRITYALIKEGKSIEEIAKQRKLAASTIEAHALRGIKENELNIISLLKEESINEVSRLIRESANSISDWHKSQNGKYSYGVYRMVQAHMAKSRNS
jgi:hypothetical protein